MKLYDKKNERLVILGQRADPEYWDRHWQTNYLVETVRAGRKNRLVKKFVTKFLQPGAKILEGGCGVGQNVYALSCWGYEAYGVDLASKTIDRVKDESPDLNVSVQDVRELNFPDNFFDGYWSLGVIEHFWEGYDDILIEIKRVIKTRGYLFLSFPYLSTLRKFKASLGLYKIFESRQKIDNFYEFILDAEAVRTHVEKYGFSFILAYPYDATKGLKDEVSFLKPTFQKIYNSQNLLATGIRFLNSILFSKITAHSILLVFKNEK